MKKLFSNILPTIAFLGMSIHCIGQVTPDSSNVWHDNPMNGISTFDLVLMSKHILGITPLNSPYKIIAADVNKSNSVTTFDIVELRKLILGTYTDLPNNTSWRFIDQTFTFSIPANPFASVPFKEDAQVDFSSSPSVGADFVGIKIGDLNNSVLANRPARRPEWGIDCTLPAARAGEVLTVPLRSLGDEPLQAFQLALRFDPAQWQLISPSAGDLPGYNAGNFGLTELDKGLIRTLWFADFNDPDQRIEPGAVLLYLSFKKIGEGQGGLSLDDDALPGLAWLLDDTECALRTQTAQMRDSAPATSWAVCRPNPTSGDVVFSIDADKEGRGRLALFGPYGHLVWMQDVTLTAGRQDIPVSDFSTLPAGVYIWKVLTPDKKTQGHLIKQ